MGDNGKTIKTIVRTIMTDVRPDGKWVRTETIVTTVDDPKDFEDKPDHGDSWLRWPWHI